MAEALVSLLVENLGSLAVQWIEEEVKLAKGAEKEVASLKTNLEDIQAVLEDAEKKKLSNPLVKRWVEKLEGVSYDMDNVLDEWKTAILEYKIGKEEGGALVRPKKEVFFPMLSSCFCFPKVNQLGLRRDIAHKIKELNEELDRIAKEKDKYNLNTTTVEQPVERQKTTSFVDETETYGRDEDKMKLASKLLSESSHHQQGLQVISIVGMGGLGKTTLAQLAYNDEKVKAHFKERIWVCVSDPFEETKIVRAIIEAIEGKAPGINELETLAQHLRKCIERKRFLLVLDDVWTENNYKWELLKQPLKYGAAGSRVLVTTRKKEVAVMMGANDESTIVLKELSEEHCWLVFKRLAFWERKEHEVERLTEIGKKIACKCRGLPLAAKILGGLMRFKNTENQWEEVLDSELWNSKDIIKKVFTPLLLSYYDLSAKEKRCFSYCSIFPKDRKILRSELIKLWMAQGFLGDDLNSQKEGHNYFENLAMRSFFQNFEKNNYDGSIRWCKMHDIVHDFAQFLTKNDCIVKEAGGIEESAKLVHGRARHLTLVVGDGVQCPSLTYNKMNEKNLRTLFIEKERPVGSSFDTSLFLNLKCLRTLKLSSCELEKLPDSVGKFIHMRYLDLSYNFHLKELPDSLCNLFNLQTLKLISCLELERLPEGVRKLVNLKHLYVRYSHKLEGLPRGIGRLMRLQVLDTLIVPYDKEAYFDIGDLNKLKQLQVSDCLHIKQCGYFESWDEAKKVDLKNMEQVVDLTLSFDGLIDKHGSQDDFAILEALEPHQNLTRLTISKYVGVTLTPKWMMSLMNLKEVLIYECKNCETLPSFWKLPSLESLSIWGLENLKKLGPDFVGIAKSNEPSKSSLISFPKLKSLIFSRMEQLEKWEGSDTTCSLTIMPCLTRLYFTSCPRLQVLPDFLETTTALKGLSIESSEILEECFRKRTGKEWTKISHIPNIRIKGDNREDDIWIQKDDGILATMSP